MNSATIGLSVSYKNFQGWNRKQKCTISCLTVQFLKSKYGRDVTTVKVVSGLDKMVLYIKLLRTAKTPAVGRSSNRNRNIPSTIKE